MANNIDPKGPRYWHERGEKLVSEGKYLEAQRAFQRAVKLDPDDFELWSSLGDALLEQGKHAEADVAYEEAAALEPHDPWPLLLLGQSLLTQGRYEAAEEKFREAVEVDPNEFWANYDLGALLAEQRKFDAAEKPLSAATILADDSDDADDVVVQARAWTYYGETLYHLGKLTEAEDSLRRSTVLDPDEAWPWMLLSYGLRDQIKYEDEELACTRFLKLEPTDADMWVALGVAQGKQGKHPEAETAFRRATRIDRASYSAWYNLAITKDQQSNDPATILPCYRRMAQCIEVFRQQHAQWVDRLGAFVNPSKLLLSAARFSTLTLYDEDALNFTVQSKARAMQELLDYKPDQLETFLADIGAVDELARLHDLKHRNDAIEKERHGWNRTPRINYQARGPITKRLQAYPPEQREEWEERKQRLQQDYYTFLHQVVISYPELEPFVGVQRFRFSLPKLQQRLGPGEGVLELHVWAEPVDDLASGFFVSKTQFSDYLYGNPSWGLKDDELTVARLRTYRSPTLRGWRDEVKSILPLDHTNGALDIESSLTSDILAKWGELLYGPFINHLKDIRRLWVSPHSFLTQLPFNAIPFPDGVDREVAVIPSAASLMRPLSKRPRPKPRFTLGVVAADSLRQNPENPQPLDLQTEEVRHLLGAVRSAKRRWALSGNELGNEPTLDNIQEQEGLTRCLVVSCHGGGPIEEWGALELGTATQPQSITGRQLVDSLLIGSKAGNIQVDLLITSACLTGQVDTEMSGEWLGLSMALQGLWKTKTMLLTLWEVQELPAMIWVVGLVEALTRGLTAGDAQKCAQKKLRTITSEQVEVLWLSEAQERLPPERWERVLNDWQLTTQAANKTANQRPFSDPVHWAPFVLVGDPRVTISPKR